MASTSPVPGFGLTSQFLRLSSCPAGTGWTGGWVNFCISPVLILTCGSWYSFFFFGLLLKTVGEG